MAQYRTLRSLQSRQPLPGPDHRRRNRPYEAHKPTPKRPRPGDRSKSIRTTYALLVMIVAHTLPAEADAGEQVGLAGGRVVAPACGCDAQIARIPADLRFSSPVGSWILTMQCKIRTY